MAEDDDPKSRRGTGTAPEPIVDLLAGEPPFIRPNPLLFPQGPRRRPTPQSFAGLPFMAAPAEGSADTAAARAASRSGEMVLVLTDGPFTLSAPVVCISPPRQHLSVIVKLSCDLVAGGAAIVREEAEPLDGDVYQGDEPDSPLLRAGDFAPVKPRCDVLLHGTASSDQKRMMSLHIEGRGGSIQARSTRASDLGAISPYSPVRLALLGTYDLAWYKTRWPHYATDLDVSYFQAAPRTQQLKEAFGDESYAILGAVEGGVGIKGRFAGVRPVAVLHLAGGQQKSVALRLDTVSFFVDERRADLVWRGLVEVSDDDAPEVEDVFVSSAIAGEADPSDAELARRYLKLKQARAGEDVDEAPVPIAEEETVADLPEPEPANDEEPAEADETALDEADVPFPTKTTAEMAASMRAAGLGDDEVAEFEEAMADPEPELPRAAPPVEDLRTIVMRRLAANEPLADLTLAGADLSELDLSKQDLSGLDLTGAQLTRCNLSDAQLDGADLSGAKLTATNLTGVSARETQFCGCDLEKAVFTGADMEAADFTEALLAGALFNDANLANVRLYDARASRASFRGSLMKGARAEAVQADAADFTGSVLDDSVWEKANLQGARFDRASMVAVSLLRARAQGASFTQADLTSARLPHADLSAAKLLRANLFEANLDRANLTKADLRGANLHAVTSVGTNLQGALMSGAITTHARIGGQSS